MKLFFLYILGFISVLPFPVYHGILLVHLIVLGIILYDFINGKNLRVYLLILIAAVLYIFIESIFGIADSKNIVEVSKYVLIIMGAVGFSGKPYFSRKLIFSFSVSALFLLILYNIFSLDIMNYGNRLGIALDDDGGVSSNTIGFILNIVYITLLLSGARYIKLLIPINLYYLYLTFSRGALLTFILINSIYFFKSLKKHYVFSIVIIISLILISPYVIDEFRIMETSGSGRDLIYNYLLIDYFSNINYILFGHGPGHINIEIYPGKFIYSAHNALIEHFWNFGIIGLFILFYVVMLTWKNRFKFNLDTSYYLIAVFSYGLSEDYFGAHTIMVMSIVLGLAISDINYYPQKVNNIKPI